MHRNKELYQFLLEKTWNLTEEWYAKLDKSDPTGVYSSNDPDIINRVKQQNYEFHKRFCAVFNQEESAFFSEFEKWVIMVAQDSNHLETPLHFILREFFRTQNQYLDLINEFVKLHEGKYSCDEINIWQRLVLKIISEVIVWFTEEYNTHSMKRLQAQQELINELSSPVISITKDIALLPLVGDIDTARAKVLLENTLQQCSRLGVTQLFLDLSGVIMIDTMVAQQLFQLIDALNLIGVKTTLSGLRPEIAQTAVQLGLTFDHVTIKSTLASAIDSAVLAK